MKCFKFIFAHILLDCLFVLFMVYFYFWVYSGKLLIRNLPLGIFIAFVIFITFKNIKNRNKTELVSEAFLTVGFFMFYLYAVKNNYDILASDFLLIKVFRGIILITMLYLFLDFIKGYLMSFIKAAHIFYIAHKEKDFTIIESVIGASLQFKSTLAVPIFNKVIRDCAKDMFNKAKECIKQPEESETPLSEFYDSVQNNKLVKLSKYMIKACTSYIDECVLVYCYSHPEKSLFKSATDSIYIFVKNSVKILSQMSAIVLLQVILKVFLYLCFVIVLFNTANLTLKSFIIYFVIIKISEFIMQDAIIEPLMLQKVLQTFLSFEPNVVTVDEIIAQFPILNKIKKLGKNNDDFDEITTQTSDSPNISETSEESIEKSDVLSTELNKATENINRDNAMPTYTASFADSDRSSSSDTERSGINFEDVIIKK